MLGHLMLKKYLAFNPVSALTAAITVLTTGQPLLAQIDIPVTPPPAVPSVPPQRSETFSIPVIPPPTPSPTSCSVVIPQKLEGMLRQDYFRGSEVGVQVETVNTDTLLYSHRANNSFIPASNIKLFTTAAILRYKSPWEKFRNSSWISWVNRSNVSSNNNIAQMLFDYLGGESNIKMALSSLGVSPSEFQQVDGSGLSRYNRATPNSLVRLLQGMESDRHGEAFFASLPVAGKSGTLSRRLKGNTTYGRVRAKTGTLRGVRTLSGYVDHPHHGLLAFSILANQPASRGHGSNLVSGIDRMVNAIATLPPCGN
jgi:D-alanyl-D-alanine carboxypeptidase/D-alanyl-D-alanine-endopeptidase (penicillin-binding protein 4)